MGEESQKFIPFREQGTGMEGIGNRYGGNRE